MLAGVITQLAYFDTWDAGIIRSTDVAGIAYHPPSGHLYLADSEINEISSIFNGDNIFETSPSGDQVFREIASNNTEPTGITYNEYDGFFYVTNDTGSKTVTRYDINLDNPLLVISTKDDVSSASDPEGITSDPSTGFLYVSDGNGGGTQVLAYDSNLQFQYVFSVANQGDAEGIAFHQPSNHLFLIDGKQDIIFEYTLNGTLLEQYDISGFSPAPKSPQGLTFGPTSNPNDDPTALALYIADGMKDNFADGRVYEAMIGSLPSNFAPTTSGIANVNVNTDAPDTVIDLFAAFDDFEDPDPDLTYTFENNTNPSLFTSTTIDGVLGTLTLDYAPATNGTADITVRATDTGTPPLFVETTFTVTVSPVNQPPTTTGIADVFDAEDAFDTVIDLFAAFDDPEEPDPSLTYTVQSNTNPALFASLPIDGTLGTLTLDYAPDANGTADITVRATDNGFPVLFVETTFTVTITEVNDTPTLTSGSVNNLTVVQNSPATPLGLAGLAYGPGGETDENGQILSYSVTTVPSSALGVIMLSDGSTIVTLGAYTLAQIQGMQFKAAPDIFGGPETFSFSVTDNGTTNGASDFKTSVQSLLIDVIEFLPTPTTFEVRVAASSDDAEEKPSGSIRLLSSDLELTQDKTNQQVVGMRFTGVNIPTAATIQNAYIQFQADEATSDATSLTIYGEAVDNATTFTSISGNVSSRTSTTASVPWSPVPWNTAGEAGPDQQTSNIAAVIQEIVNRPGWSSGNSLAIVIDGTGKRVAEAFDGISTAAPLLHVEYLPATDSVPIAVNDTATTPQDTAVTVDVLINDFLGDPPTDITGVTQGSNGGVTFDASAGTTTYTPIASFTGTDSYTYTITDTDGDMSTATVDVTVGAAQATINIRVMADVPYSSGEFAQLEADLANVGPDDEFFVHLGDVKAGSDPCVESAYTSVASSLQTSSIPVFMVPGDNEWNDCADPNQAWTYWDTHLMLFDENWSHSFNVLHQSVREENFAYVHSGVLFVGINLVGGSVHDSSEWAQRMTDDADWVNENFNNFGSQVTSAVVFGHAFPDPTGGDRQQFGQDFVTAAQSFGKPILYMMGDDHAWVLDNPYPSAPNVTRVTVDQGVPSVRVTISDDPTDPFTFDQSPLMLQSTVDPPPGAEAINESQLAPIVDAAIVRLSLSTSPDVASILAEVNFEVVDLPGNMLGRAMGNTIQIDANAAGFGWFVDPTPYDDTEFIYDSATNQFVAPSDSAASGRVDLLTAVMHELGHVLGLEHTDSNGLMDPELSLGTRRVAGESSISNLDAFSLIDYEQLGSLFTELDDLHKNKFIKLF